MSEGIKWTKPFGWFTFASGWVVVKENKFFFKKNKIELMGKVVEKDKVIMTPGATRIYDLYTCDIEYLPFILKLDSIRENVKRQAGRIYNERVKASIDGTSLAGKNFPIIINMPDTITIKLKRIEAKNGVKFRFFWQRILKLPVVAQQVDTPTYTEVITSDNIKIDLDVDYEYVIVDPITYTNKFNLFWEKPSSEVEKPAKALNDAISKDIEKIFKPYVNSNKLDVVRGFVGKTELLLTVFRNELANIGSEYGIEITKLYIEQITLPKSMLDSVENDRNAEINASAARKKAQGEADAKMIAAKAEAEAKRLDYQVQEEYYKKLGFTPEQIRDAVIAGKGTKVVKVDGANINVNNTTTNTTTKTDGAKKK